MRRVGQPFPTGLLFRVAILAGFEGGDFGPGFDFSFFWSRSLLPRAGSDLSRCVVEQDCGLDCAEVGANPRLDRASAQADRRLRGL
jgi:hypothetical protein